MVIATEQELVARARELAEQPGRRILGIAGKPGGGKSTVARSVVAELADRARLVPMDGFHLAQPELVRLGRRERMGAPDTFDAAGYAALLTRLRGPDAVVYAPEFRREIEEPIAGAIAVPCQVPLVVTEGNYLLFDEGPWSAVRTLLDEVWFIETDEALRRQRLVQRHVEHGRTPQAASEWVARSDEANAARVARTRVRADAVLRW